MTKKRHDIFLAARFTDNSQGLSQRDLEFIEEKLASGMKKSDLLRQAIINYRKYLSGQLFKEEFGQQLKELIKDELVETLKEANISIASEEEESNITKEQMEEATKKLQDKIMTNSFI